MSRIPCPDCGKHKYDPDLYERCYQCNMENDGKVRCPMCHDKYYDPTMYEGCFDCEEDRKAQIREDEYDG